ncbi:MAG: hypothetical protein QTN59_14965 [Candidatus Electrothrix communis]|nr:hypothetical protein [Desulfobulbus sp. US4]WLE95973.1 MAG: hypothetical protein QTN59_14965 [Candidatus Electrothrix communis]
MFARELCVRLRENLIVEEKGNSWVKENRKEYVAGEWLFGCFIEVDNRRVFRSGNLFLSLSYFDRMKFSASGRGGIGKDELDELLNFFSDVDQEDSDDIEKGRSRMYEEAEGMVGSP